MIQLSATPVSLVHALPSNRHGLRRLTELSRDHTKHRLPTQGERAARGKWRRTPCAIAQRRWSRREFGCHNRDRMRRERGVAHPEFSIDVDGVKRSDGHRAGGDGEGDPRRCIGVHVEGRRSGFRAPVIDDRDAEGAVDGVSPAIHDNHRVVHRRVDGTDLLRPFDLDRERPGRVLWLEKGKARCGEQATGQHDKQQRTTMWQFFHTPPWSTECNGIRLRVAVSPDRCNRLWRAGCAYSGKGLPLVSGANQTQAMPTR